METGSLSRRGRSHTQSGVAFSRFSPSDLVPAVTGYCVAKATKLDRECNPTKIGSRLRPTKIGSRLRPTRSPGVLVGFISKDQVWSDEMRMPPLGEPEHASSRMIKYVWLRPQLTRYPPGRFPRGRILVDVTRVLLRMRTCSASGGQDGAPQAYIDNLTGEVLNSPPDASRFLPRACKHVPEM